MLLTMDHSRDRQPISRTPPPTGSQPLAPRDAASRAAAEQECCDRCGSVRLIRVKACWRCEACGYKSDCNGW
jgi:hypothetical protein